MQPFAWLRRIFLILKSQGTPVQIGLGICAGMMLGLTPMGLHWLPVVCLALTFNISWGGVTLGFALFKLAYVGARPLSYALGYYVLEQWQGLDGLWAQVFHWPILAWLGLNQYLVFGGYLLALLGSLAVFPLTVWGVRGYRAGYGSRLRSEQLKQLGQTWYGKLARWAAVGGEARFRDVKVRPWPFRIVRWQALIALPLLLSLGYVVSAYTVPFFAQTLVTAPTSLLLGTQARVGTASFDPLSGLITLDDFRVADPKDPAQDVLVVGQSRLDVGLVGLLQRRAVINHASVSSIQLHVKREADGSINLDNVGSGWDVQGYLDWLAQNAGKVDWWGLLQKLWDYWQSRPPASPPAPQPDLSGAHPLPLPHSWFALERIGAERFELTLVDEYGRGGPLPALRKAELALENVELPPRFARRPLTLALRGELADMPGATLEVSAQFEPQGQGKFVSTYHLAVRQVELPPFAPLYEKTLPVRLVQGRLTLAGSAVIGPDGALRGQASLSLEGLRFERTAAHPSLFGLDPLTSDYVVQGINRFAQESPIEFQFDLSGTTAHPKFGWNAAFIQVAIQGLELQANLLLRPYIELLKAHLQSLGVAEALPALDAEEGVKSIENFLQQLWQGLGGKDEQK